MKILILGGDGMLGHECLRSWSPRHEVRVSLRQGQEAYQQFQLFNQNNSFYNVDVRRFERVREIIAEFRPDAVLNAVGVVKQRDAAKERLTSIQINALFPHLLAELCEEFNSRLVAISTDCIFSGDRGNYVEDNPSDAYDVYGKSKYLGEVDAPHCVTLRSSIIGIELQHFTSLVGWYLQQKGVIRGFTNAIYTGLTTMEMARVIEKILLEHQGLHGVYHVASAPINKYVLLNTLTQKLKRTDASVFPDDHFQCDRSLNGEAFALKTGYVAPSWDSMLDELAAQIIERGLFSVENKKVSDPIL
jgi:dTDP-4-dehydrorhamnose reductase